MLKELKTENSDIEILSSDSPEMNLYGRVIDGIDFSDMQAYIMTCSEPKKTAYIRDLRILRDCPSFLKIQKRIYGSKTQLQSGLCFGMNSRMNGMEYHLGSEVIIALTDLILILGRKEDISSNSWDSSLAQCFFLPGGTSVELFEGTLHLAPCRTSQLPFCAVIILPEGTNTALNKNSKSADPLLFMNNKWLICHKESPAVSKGGFVGITGDNIQINI